MINQTITWGEVIWTLVGILGVVIHSALTKFYLKDFRSAIARGRAPAEVLVSKSNIRRQVVYTTTQLFVVLLGVSAMTEPLPAVEYTKATILGSLFIIAWEVLLIGNAVMDYFDRATLLTYIRKHPKVWEG